MIEPVSAAVVLYAAARWSWAGSERIVMRARTDVIDAATRLRPGTRIDSVSRDGSRWAVAVPSVPRLAAEEAGDGR